MNNKKYKILVLSDLKDTTANILKSTISLANMIEGEINFFHVKKATDIVAGDNQLSAIRSINEQYVLVEKEIQNFIRPISDIYNVNINCEFSVGNVKNELEKHIKENQPDIIVLGKRNPRIMKFIGDSITHFVLNNFDGIVMLASESKAIDTNKKLSLGILNSSEPVLNIDFSEQLMRNSHKPIKAFNIIKKSKENINDSAVSNSQILEYAFEDSSNALENLSKYLSKSNIDLLFIDREKNSKKASNKLVNSDIDDIIDTLDTSLIVSAKKVKNTSFSGKENKQRTLIKI